jgi:hypothetical protein
VIASGECGFRLNRAGEELEFWQESRRILEPISSERLRLCKNADVMAALNSKTYAVSPEAYASFYEQALAYGLVLQSGDQNAGVLSGHGVTVSFKYSAPASANVTITKKEGFAKLVTNDHIWSEIDKFVAAPPKV